MTTIDQLLAALAPSQFALQPLFHANVTEDMLREIAAADYGYMKEECFELLQPVWRTGLVESGEFMLREVLELIRWSEPEISNWSPGGKETRGHWMRLFSCAALIQRAVRVPLHFQGESETLAQLLSSAIVLGEPVARASARMLAWRFLAYPGDEDCDRPFFAFAILLLATYLERSESCGAWLKELAEWVQREESQIPEEDGCTNSEWLLGITYYNQREAVWRELAHHILTDPKLPHPSAANEALRRLGGRISRQRQP